MDSKRAKEHLAWAVSYRQRWWNRRRYACSCYIHAEAIRCAEWMSTAGYRRVRIEVGA